MLKAFVLETSTAPGNATTINLNGAVSGYNTFLAAGFSNGDPVFYYMYDGVQGEFGTGVFNTGSPNTLTRTTVEGNTAGSTARLSFASTTNVYNYIPPGKALYLNSAGSLSKIVTDVSLAGSGDWVLSGVDMNINMSGNYVLSATGNTTLLATGTATLGSTAATVVSSSGGVTIQADNNPLIVKVGGGVERARWATTGGTLSLHGGAVTTPIASTTDGFAFKNAAVAGTGYMGELYHAGGAGWAIGSNTSGAAALGLFFGGSTQVGSITITATTTTYNTTSDRRLKTDLCLIAGGVASDIIARLKPRWFNWKSRPDDPAEPGFFAQEVARVFPWAVTRGKGRPGRPGFIPWQIDAAKLLPVVIAELQALRAEIEALKNGSISE